MATMAVNYKTLAPVQDDWQDYLEHVAHREDLLLEIKDLFGYGGAIHNFKNYGVRGTPKYFDRTRNKLDELLKVAEEYRGIDGVTVEEKNALVSIEKVAGQYRDATEQVRKLHADDASISQIDTAVKIDDSPAIKGFAVLQEKFE